MPTTGCTPRSDLQDVPAATHVYPLVNAVLSGPATLAWDAGGGSLVITGNIYCYALSNAAYAGGTVNSITTEGDAVVLYFDRSTSNPTPTAAKVAQHVLAWEDSEDLAPGGTRPNGGEGIVVLGHRGADGRFYLRNGQVVSQNSTVALGTTPGRTVREVTTVLVGIPDYDDVLASGATAAEGTLDLTADAVAVNLVYPLGTGRLKVYCNGLLLEPDYLAADFDSGDIGTFPAFEAGGPRGDYHEVYAADGVGAYIQFYDGYVPPSGSRLQFILD